MAAAKDPKTKRRFLESVELQIGLKNLDPAVRYHFVLRVLLLSNDAREGHAEQFCDLSLGALDY